MVDPEPQYRSVPELASRVIDSNSCSICSGASRVGLDGVGVLVAVTTPEALGFGPVDPARSAGVDWVVRKSHPTSAETMRQAAPRPARPARDTSRDIARRAYQMIMSEW
jgi:hypothetical protein